jgi:hypothetical protein
VHYSNSVTVCQGGQPASLDALRQGASVSVFGPLRRNGKNMEIDAARIFVAGRPQTARPCAEPARPNAQEVQPPNAPQTQPPKEIRLGEAEQAAVEDGVAAYEKLLVKLAELPTPAGLTQRQIGAELVQITSVRQVCRTPGVTREK